MPFISIVTIHAIFSCFIVVATAMPFTSHKIISQQGHYEAIKCTEYINLHNDIIRQVSFASSMKSIISCSESTITKDAYLPGVIITHLSLQNSQMHTVFKMNSVSKPNFFHHQNLCFSFSSFFFVGRNLFCF